MLTSTTRHGPDTGLSECSAGQCGPGPTVEACALPAAVEGALAQGVRRISAGSAFSLFVTDQGVVRTEEGKEGGRWRGGC